jgi:type IV secretion system protein VirB1
MFEMALIDMCKNPGVESALIKQIIQVESGYQEFTVNVNKLESFKLKTRQEAEETAKKYIAKGYSVDMGLMQFNSKNLNSPHFKDLTISDLFDPCKNIKAGSDVFALAYESTDKGLSKEDRINKALSIYNTGNQELGFRNGYVAKYSSLPTLVATASLEEQARKADTRINLSYNLFNLESKKGANK